MPLIMAGVMAGSAGLGAIGAHQSTKRRRTDRRRLIQFADQLGGQQGRYFAEASQYLKQAKQGVTQGYERARAEASRTAGAARRGAKERGQQTGAAIQQNLTDRGLYSTTAFDNAQRGVSADVTRQLQDIDSQFAALQADLFRGQGVAEANIRSQQSNLAMQQSAANVGMQSHVRGSYLGLNQGAGYAPPSGGQGAALGGGLMELLPYLMGGGGGNAALGNMEFFKGFNG